MIRSVYRAEDPTGQLLFMTGDAEELDKNSFEVLHLSGEQVILVAGRPATELSGCHVRKTNLSLFGTDNYSKTHAYVMC